MKGGCDTARYDVTYFLQVTESRSVDLLNILSLRVIFILTVGSNRVGLIVSGNLPLLFCVHVLGSFSRNHICSFNSSRDDSWIKWA